MVGEKKKRMGLAMRLETIGDSRVNEVTIGRSQHHFMVKVEALETKSPSKFPRLLKLL